MSAAELEALKARVAALEARLTLVEAGRSAGATCGAAVADDSDLDGDYGDEIIKRDPKRWLEKGGESYAGCKMSECPPDYLMTVASLFDWMASQDEAKGKTYKNKRTGKEEPTAPFSRKTAARARGWARRNRERFANGAAATAAPQPDPNDVEVPF